MNIHTQHGEVNRLIGSNTRIHWRGAEKRQAWLPANAALFNHGEKRSTLSNGFFYSQLRDKKKIHTTKVLYKTVERGAGVNNQTNLC